MMSWWTIAGLVLIAAALVYWLVNVTEGAYLGERTVITLYDRFADRYDGVKRFDPDVESYFLGQPIASVLAEVTGRGHNPLVLDVATGTGRLPLAVWQAAGPDVHIVGLDGSLNMLKKANAKLSHVASLVLIQHEASPLPFVADAFDVVTCLEVLEFVPNPRTVLAELLRVTRPGGMLMVTNRIGWQARLMPGKAFRPQEFARFLERLGAIDVRAQPWQIDYDLVTAFKPGVAMDEASTWPAILQCPRCHHRLVRPEVGHDLATWVCSSATCGWQLHRQDEIWRVGKPGTQSRAGRIPAS